MREMSVHNETSKLAVDSRSATRVTNPLRWMLQTDPAVADMMAVAGNPIARVMITRSRSRIRQLKKRCPFVKASFREKSG
jgi:hypothetical protein